MLRHVEIYEVTEMVEHIDACVQFDEERRFRDPDVTFSFRLRRLERERGEGLEFGEP